LLLLLPFLAAGCRRPDAGAPSARLTPATRAVVVPASQPASRPAPASAASQPASPIDRVVVGGDKGLSVYDAEGKLLRVLKGRRATAPRYLAGHRAVVYLGGSSHGALGFEGVWRLDLITGEEKLVARMPLLRMVRGDPPEAWDGALNPDTDGGAWVEPPDRALCLRLVDGEGDTTNVTLSMRVDLMSGEVTRNLDLLVGTYRFVKPRLEPKEGTALCRAPVEVRGDPDAPGRVEVQLKVARAAYPFSIDDKGQLVERRGGRARRVPLFHREESDRPKGPADYETGLPGPVFTESGPLLPPGRWVLLSGNAFRGDLFHTQYLIMDRQSGAIFRLPSPKRPAPWPKPIPLAQLQRMKPLEFDGLDVPAGIAVRAVGSAGSFHASWTLFVPGVRVVPLNGNPAL